MPWLLSASEAAVAASFTETLRAHRFHRCDAWDTSQIVLSPGTPAVMTPLAHNLVPAAPAVLELAFCIKVQQLHSNPAPLCLAILHEEDPHQQQSELLHAMFIRT
jgi:hypothetical protein